MFDKIRTTFANDFRSQKIDSYPDFFERLEKDQDELKKIAQDTKIVASEVISQLRNELNDVTKKFHELSSIVQDGLIVIDENGEITDYSPAAERIFQWSKKECIGKTISMFTLPNHYRFFKEILSENEEPILNIKNGKAIKKDGDLIDIEFTISKLMFNNQMFNFVVVRDVTAKTRYLHEIEAKNKIMAAITACSTLWFKQDWKENIDYGLRLLGESIGADTVSISKITDECCEIQYIWVNQEENRSEFNCELFDIHQFIPELETGNFVLITEKTHPEIMNTINRKALIFLPIRTFGKLWGFFIYHFKHKSWFFNRIIGTLTILSDVFGATLERKGKDKEIQILQQTLNGLSDSLLITDTNGKILFSNKSFCDKVNKPYHKIIGKDFWTEEKNEFWLELQKGETWQGDVDFKLSKQRLKAYSIIIPVVNGKPNRPSYFLVVVKEWIKT